MKQEKNSNVLICLSKTQIPSWTTQETFLIQINPVGKKWEYTEARISETQESANPAGFSCAIQQVCVQVLLWLLTQSMWPEGFPDQDAV